MQQGLALPQFIFVPLAAILLRRIDARILVAVGFALIAYAAWLNTGLTHDWAGNDLLPSQIAGAVGLAFGITALIVFGVANITPADAPTIAAMIQIGRLFPSWPLPRGSTCSPGCRGDKPARPRRAFVPVRHRPRLRPPAARFPLNLSRRSKPADCSSISVINRRQRLRHD
jgi:hypothetical protein